MDTFFDDFPAETAPAKAGAKAQLLNQVGTIRRKKNETVKQLPQTIPLWDESERGFPNELARGALFTSTKHERNGVQRPTYTNIQVASLAGVEIMYRGEELRQDDASVLMALFHMGRAKPLNEPIYFSGYAMLKELGWSINKTEYDHLKECCLRLKATAVTITTTDNKKGDVYSLIEAFGWREEDGTGGQAKWRVSLQPKIAQLFENNRYSLFAREDRRKIGGKSPLALWLHNFLCTHRDPYDISVDKYRQLSASKAKDLSDFRRRLKLALQKLVDINFLDSFIINSNDVVHVERARRVTRLVNPD